jgi:pimeloyl-ACP methyl ester carboxylesterase
VHEDWGERAERWRGVRSEYVDVQGTSVHALRAGDDVDGPTQLLVHGLGGSATNWIEVIPGLAERGPVIAPDLPGFGRTEPPTRTASRVRFNARFLRTLLDTIGWGSAEVHGNSMGGMLTVLLAGLAPERVDRLVLVSPALPTAMREISQVHTSTLLRFAPFLIPGVGEAVVRRLYARTTPEGYWDDLVTYLYADPDRLSPEIRQVGLENIRFGREAGWRLPAFVGAAESVVGSLLRPGRLKRAIDGIDAPTLLLWGDADRLVGRHVVDAARKRRPDWTITLMEGVGHVPMIEVPQLYLELVSRWLAGDELPEELTV